MKSRQIRLRKIRYKTFVFSTELNPSISISMLFIRKTNKTLCGVEGGQPGGAEASSWFVQFGFVADHSNQDLKPVWVKLSRGNKFELKHNLAFNKALHLSF